MLKHNQLYSPSQILFPACLDLANDENWTKTPSLAFLKVQKLGKDAFPPLPLFSCENVNKRGGAVGNASKHRLRKIFNSAYAAL